LSSARPAEPAATTGQTEERGSGPQASSPQETTSGTATTATPDVNAGDGPQIDPSSLPHHLVEEFMRLPPHLQAFIRLQHSLAEAIPEGDSSIRPSSNFHQMTPIAVVDDGPTLVSPSHDLSTNNHARDVNQQDRTSENEDTRSFSFKRFFLKPFRTRR